MPTRKSVQQTWHESASGLVVPDGTVLDLSFSSANTYLQIKEKALAIEQLYADSNVPLAPTCTLAQLIAEAKVLSDAWFTNQINSITGSMLLRVGYLDRIADAVLPLRYVSDHAPYLTALTSRGLDCLERQPSKAKDTLWELELWSILRWRSLEATLAEPPDIVVAFEDAKIGIACKKFYSVKHVQNVLSQAVAQIAGSFDFGIVAINLDDLVPSKIFQLSTQDTMRRAIDAFNTQFLRAHERHFRKYLAKGRLLSALVSTRILVDVYRGDRSQHARQSTFWAIPGLPQEKERQLKRFYDQFIG